MPFARPAFRRFSTEFGYFSDIRKVYRCAVSVCDDQRPVVGRLVSLVVGVDLIAPVADINSALRTVRIGAGKSGSYVLKTDAVFIECLRNKFDPDRWQRAAADDDFADTLDLRQFLRQHRRCRVIQIAARHRVGSQGQDKDRRVGGIDLAVRRIGAQAGRKIGAGRIDCRLHVARRAVNVAVESELQGDARRSHRARRGHLGHVGNLAKMTFERAGDRRGDILRAGAGQGRLHRNCREIDLRKR